MSTTIDTLYKAYERVLAAKEGEPGEVDAVKEFLAVVAAHAGPIIQTLQAAEILFDTLENGLDPRYYSESNDAVRALKDTLTALEE